MTTDLYAVPDPDDEPGLAPQFERVPPFDLWAEQSVLGAMMLSKDAVSDVLEILKPRDYYRGPHEVVHDAIVTLFSRGEPTDPISVTGLLTERGEIVKVGGPAYIHQLVESTPGPGSAQHHAGLVHEAAVLRRLVEAGARIQEMGYQRQGNAAELVDAAQSEVFAVADERTEEECLPVADTIMRTVDRVQDRQENGDKVTGVPTGFADLDSLTGGLQPGQMVVIAARPAIGKSTLALDFARACAIKHQMACAFFSLEMSREEIELRLLSAEGKIPLHHLRSGQMTDDDWARVARRMPEISGAPLYLDTSPNLTAMDVRTKARRLHQKHGLKLLIVDYLQLMQSGGGRAETRQLEVSDISRSMKLLAKELHIPVVALSQLNRGPEQRADKKPALSDLRESGSIEQDADVAILLHREDAYDKESQRAGEADLIVAKHRNGSTTTVTTAFQGHYSRFVDFAPGA